MWCNTATSGFAAGNLIIGALQVCEANGTEDTACTECREANGGSSFSVVTV